MKNIISLVLFITVLQPMNAQKSNNKFEWPEGKKAAVCLTYDDGLDCHLDVAVPALGEYGFHGTFFATGNSPSLQNRVEEWREIAKGGHELGNHTLFHPCDAEQLDWVRPEYDLSQYTEDQILAELYTANTLLKAIDGNEKRTYGYTCSHHIIKGGESYSERLSDLFVAARSDGPVPDKMSEVDPYFVPSWCVDSHSGEELIAYVKDALEKGTMAVFMFHSVGGGYLNVSDEAHRELLGFLDKHRDEIWTGTFLEVMSYVKEKE